MSKVWKERLLLLLRFLVQFGDMRYRLVLSLPQTTLDALLELKLLPKDGILQVIKDAIETHNQVVGAIRSGGTIFVHRGAVVVPLNLKHLTTPNVRRASFEIIKGGRDD